MVLTNAVMTNNTALGSGGGGCISVFSLDSQSVTKIVVANVTATHNRQTGPGSGGGLCVSGGAVGSLDSTDVVVTNVSVFNNTGSSGEPRSWWWLAPETAFPPLPPAFLIFSG